MKIKKSIDDTVIYQTKNGAITLKQDISADMLWASQNHIADIFEVNRPAITKHIRNILKDKELDANSVCSKMEHTAEDGKTYKVQFYSLDVILAVGYRVNSKKAIAFRQWATKTLKDHIFKGYTINKNRIQKNYDDFLKAINDVKTLLPTGSVIDHDSILELVTLFADTWFSLDAYDKDQLVTQGTTKKKVALTADKLNKALAELKQNLISKNEATDIFGVERTKDSIAGIIGNVMQSFGGEELYPSIEEKAAHLLYFIIKNHPFVDGNKRSGAYAFIWFLRSAKALDLTRITPPALTAITLLIAESSPKGKDKMIGLVCTLLVNRKKST
ncbi:MAG TPA: virulence protein RhuM/Fic/DOC family protein [Gammaproteobacteria bacterium]|nr:virulence protein RhuM/Fic/DOC family protein [Gammaproteobacteria bacterium]